MYLLFLCATSLRGALEGVGPENRDFLDPEMARAKRVPFGPKKVEKEHEKEHDTVQYLVCNAKQIKEKIKLFHRGNDGFVPTIDETNHLLKG
jgi:hypothetical protein